LAVLEQNGVLSDLPRPYFLKMLGGQRQGIRRERPGQPFFPAP